MEGEYISMQFLFPLIFHQSNIPPCMFYYFCLRCLRFANLASLNFDWCESELSWQLVFASEKLEHVTLIV